jgi:hypothetical protein
MEITKYTVIYGVYIQFWPTLLIKFVFTESSKNIMLSRVVLVDSQTASWLEKRTLFFSPWT